MWVGFKLGRKEKVFLQEIQEVILYQNTNIRENGMQICWYFGKYLVRKGLKYLFDGELV